MDKMNGKFFKYTLILLGVAILFIIIGGISVARVDEYKKPVKMITVPTQQYTDLQKNIQKMEKERQQIVNILLEESTEEEKIEKIQEIFLGE